MYFRPTNKDCAAEAIATMVYVPQVPALLPQQPLLTLQQQHLRLQHQQQQLPQPPQPAMPRGSRSVMTPLTPPSTPCIAVSPTLATRLSVASSSALVLICQRGQHAGPVQLLEHLVAPVPLASCARMESVHQMVSERKISFTIVLSNLLCSRPYLC